MKQITVGMADMKIGTGDIEFVTYALGSCIGVCMYDEVTEVGGMLHAMLSDRTDTDDIEKYNPLRYIKSGIPVLYNRLCGMGADRRRLKAKIIGGARMFDYGYGDRAIDVGAQNVITTKRCLQSIGVPIIAEQTGGSVGRTIWFGLGDNKVKIKTTENKIFMI